jgi:hypothetical protein
MSKLMIPDAVLDTARCFFEECGAVGCEGTALIAAVADIATRVVVPDQRARAAPHCSVEVTTQGKLELAAALRPNEYYAARIHSHPALPFHSPTDDRNPAITHDGALSIVVPFFGLGLRRGLDSCAVYLRETQRWTELQPGLDRDRFIVSQ